MERMEGAGEKSFRKEELTEEFYLPKRAVLVPYLEVKLDLERR